MKVCACCQVAKETAEFVASKSRKDGLHPYCKTCHSEKSRRWVAANKEKRAEVRRMSQSRHQAEKNAYSRARYHENLEAERLRSKAYRQQNPQTSASRSKRWNQSFPGRRNAITAKRRAVLKQAMPRWADELAIQRIYQAAKQRTAETGVVHHVDHVIPLQGRRVCGLHVACNLRVITRRENQSKSNKLIEGVTLV